MDEKPTWERSRFCGGTIHTLYGNPNGKRLPLESLANQLSHAEEREIGLIDPLERERDGLGNGVMGDNHSTQSLASSQRANCRTKKESDAGWRVKLGLFFRYRYPIPSPKLY
ncbi:hypothetical protein SAY86_020626 [Trapa natans]|uniref:Uncharacterized protein n=1 Tax=Trapa natans TaxID=22666 RepID=A0AAN7LZZ4_TRANT|nr:hypothetical protein SAY86_020626 [Trapa natans]